jgi:oligo-1,6-glucosidase
MVSRFGNDDEYRRESATLLGTLLHTLQGTPYVYQGEELGMTNYPFESLDDFRDVDTLNPLRNAIDAGEVEDFASVREAVNANSRDNARTPMQWSDEEHAGFTDGEPWIGVNPNYEEINAARERDDPDSVWHYYRDLIALRGDYDVLVYGEYENYRPAHESLWVYTRTLGDERLLVTLNVSNSATEFERPAEVSVDGVETVELLIDNYADVDGAPATVADLDGFDLRPWEARVYHLS